MEHIINENSKNFSQAVLDSIPANIAVLDCDANIIAVNKAWHKFSANADSKNQNRSVGVNYIEVCQKAKEAGEDVSEVISGIKGILNGKKSLFVHEYPCPAPGGKEYWFLLRAAPLVYENSLNGAVVFHFDITDKKKSERSLKKSEEKFRSFVENAHDIIFTVTSNGIFTYMSPNCKNILGYKAEEVIGKSFMRFVHHDDIIKLTRKLNEKAKEHSGAKTKLLGTESIEYRAWDKFGNYRWLSVKTSLLSYDNNKFEIMGIARDITDQKQMEEELDKHYEELEHLYEELDKEINKAKEIHEKTLPSKFPELTKASISAFYQPAEFIGGDFYNVIKNNNQLIIYLSDVTGHGLDSAMMSAFIKNTINTYISLTEENIYPEKLMEFLAKQFIKEGYPEDLFICISIAVLDLDKNTLQFSNAGIHELPLISYPKRDNTEIKICGLPISSAIAWKHYNFENKEINLEPGTTILFATDGLAEQISSNKPYKEKLAKTFYEHSHLPPEVIAEVIKNDFANFNNGFLQGDDDITFLILQLDKEDKITYRFEIDSDFDDVDWVIQKITPKLPNIEKSQQMLIAIHELAANAIEHGNNYDRNKQVTIEFNLVENEYMMVSIEDEGEGFHWEQKLKTSLELEGEEERGRGISISRVVSDEICYNHKGNKVYLIINL
ncbi:SpoIIE family protein phosphatase [Natranaerofaba carboxydovora]|uniref:SpoIIE family protein phosphatase n=1 Tax=Natranaerofaba carboxydovora TaxID=2742683 RepID=UPI001F134A01|nr:PAS domain S-box protein [Natranaerofaba carboxydovora]UMZ74905.1 Phosphoserine phosphatase RsbU [Natranaerofaba carboxydovora]